MINRSAFAIVRDRSPNSSSKIFKSRNNLDVGLISPETPVAVYGARGRRADERVFSSTYAGSRTKGHVELSLEWLAIGRETPIRINETTDRGLHKFSRDFSSYTLYSSFSSLAIYF